LTIQLPHGILISSVRDREVFSMKKSEVFELIKEANVLVDKMAALVVDSEEYNNVADSLYWTMESLNMGYHPWYTVHLSKKTGHYYVRFAN
jgi:hypothetical protein